MKNKQTFIVPGNPIPQKRHTMGKGYSYDPSAPDKKRVRLEILLANRKKFIHKGGVSMFITFHMKRPKNHYRTGKHSNFLKEGSPYEHTKKPDIDNMLKFLMDCCTGILFKDDSQVNHLSVMKAYTKEKPRTEFDIIYK